jgi:type I restriction-modification system DNA methylase subunit
LSISQNIVGLLYEVIVEERFRHQLGQFYTPLDVVDLLVTFAVRDPRDLLLDPATGGGSFLRSAYVRKRDIGASHERALADIWGCEITAFAAELSTVTLATSDTREPAAYPRVLLRDFFDMRPGLETTLEIPGMLGRLHIPEHFDAVIGNPPYISYRRLTNQDAIINALASDAELVLPKFSGKSDAYLWFIVHATRFLRQGGRLAFVVSAGMLFSDYGLPLIRFIGRHYRIRAVVDSIVERWFPEADTNTVLLFLEREQDAEARASNLMRFVRLRRPLAQMMPPPEDAGRRGAIEDLLDKIVTVDTGDVDPRMQINVVSQGAEGGLTLDEVSDEPDLLDEEEE